MAAKKNPLPGGESQRHFKTLKTLKLLDWWSLHLDWWDLGGKYIG